MNEHQDSNPEVPPEKPVSPGLNQEETTWGMFAHLSGILAVVVVPTVGGWIGPLIVMLVKGQDSDFVNREAKEALNFQITAIIGYVIAWGLTLVTCGVAAPVLLVPFILQIVFGIIGGLKANNGEPYDYPFNIRLIN